LFDTKDRVARKQILLDLTIVVGNSWITCGRHELWRRETYLCLETLIKIAIGVYETFILTSPIYGVLEGGTKFGDTTQYFSLGIIGDGSRKICQLFVAFDEKSIYILLQLWQTEK
jgi:hypothetical protein